MTMTIYLQKPIKYLEKKHKKTKETLPSTTDGIYDSFKD
jgi:hypothetical protein